MFFLIFISFLSLILYLIRFNTNNKRHFLNTGDTFKHINTHIQTQSHKDGQKGRIKEEK